MHVVEKRLLAVSLILSCGLLLAQEEESPPCHTENSCTEHPHIENFETVVVRETIDFAAHPIKYLLKLFLRNPPSYSSCAPPSAQNCTCPVCTGASYSCSPAPKHVHGCQCAACCGPAHYQRPINPYQACYCHECVQARCRAAEPYLQPCACNACTQTPLQKAQPPPQPTQQVEIVCEPSCIETCEEDVPTTYQISCPDCQWESYISVDFLYWYAKETNLIYGQKFKVVNQLLDGENDSTATFVFAPKTSLNFDTDWEPGIRLGRGWNVDGQGWDFYLTWTYFSSSVHETARIPGFSLGAIKAFPGFAQEGLINPWINPSFSSMVENEENLPFIFNKICASWKFRYNNFDFEIGKKFCFSSCFNIRTYTGIRAAWTKTEFETKSYRNYSDNVTGHTDVCFKDEFKNNYWGVGLLGGLEPNWYFSCNYSLFANLNASLIWGKMNLKKVERYKETQTFTGERINYKNDSSSDSYQLTPILDLAIGLRWERAWCCDSFRTELDFGWEQHIWFEHNQRYKGGSPFAIRQNSSLPTLTGYGELEETSSNVMYGGLTVRFRLDF